jgi:hypothetical protein
MPHQTASIVAVNIHNSNTTPAYHLHPCIMHIIDGGTIILSYSSIRQHLHLSTLSAYASKCVLACKMNVHTDATLTLYTMTWQSCAAHHTYILHNNNPQICVECILMQVMLNNEGGRL